MLTRVAEDFGFKIATFQHVLEGYKVAERLSEHGAGASTFSDWWQYKFEVIDAIPYNGALMTKNNVLVSYNSDDDELARSVFSQAISDRLCATIPLGTTPPTRRGILYASVGAGASRDPPGPPAASAQPSRQVP